MTTAGAVHLPGALALATQARYLWQTPQAEAVDELGPWVAYRQPVLVIHERHVEASERRRWAAGNRMALVLTNDGLGWYDAEDLSPVDDER